MWKHEILASLKWQSTLNLPDSYAILLKSVIQPVEEAPNIHIGDAGSIESARKILGEEEPYLLMDNEEMMRCPFPKSLFTFCPSEYGIADSKRMAVCVHQDENGIYTTAFLYEPRSRQWLIYPYTSACTPFSDGIAQLYDPATVMKWPLSREQSETFMLRLIYVVHATLYTLNARNIYLEAVERPAKLNKKRKKNGKIPLYRYHVLKVAPGLVRKNGQHENTHPVPGSMPVHLCRGHFKTYTAEAPMFGIRGNYGRFWVQAHVRGNKQRGIVMKDYELK